MMGGISSGLGFQRRRCCMSLRARWMNLRARMNTPTLPVNGAVGGMILTASLCGGMRRWRTTRLGKLLIFPVKTPKVSLSLCLAWARRLMARLMTRTKTCPPGGLTSGTLGLKARKTGLR